MRPLDPIHTAIVSVLPLRPRTSKPSLLPSININRRSPKVPIQEAFRKKGFVIDAVATKSLVQGAEIQKTEEALAIDRKSLLNLLWARSATATLAASGLPDSEIFKRETIGDGGAEDLRSLGKDVATFAAAGAALGTQIPGIGNVIGAIGGAIAGLVNGLVNALNKEAEVRTQRLLAWMILGQLVEQIGPPPTQIALVVGQNTKTVDTLPDPFAKIVQIMDIAAELQTRFPKAWKACPAMTKGTFETLVIPALTTETERIYGGCLMIAPTWRPVFDSSLMVGPNAPPLPEGVWGPQKPLAIGGETYTPAQQDRLAETGLLTFTLQRIFPELYPAAKKGYLTRQEADKLGKTVSRQKRIKTLWKGREVLVSDDPYTLTLASVTLETEPLVQ